MTADTDSTTRRRGRRILIAIAIASVALVGGVQLLRSRLLADLCPATVTSQGTTPDGVGWDVARSDCDGGRTVWQLRIVPQKGVSTLVYESEGGPLPLGWSQSGFTGTLKLAAPLDGDGDAAYPVPLDVKGRPIAALRARDGHRLPAR